MQAVKLSQLAKRSFSSRDLAAQNILFATARTVKATLGEKTFYFTFLPANSPISAAMSVEWKVNGNLFQLDLASTSGLNALESRLKDLDWFSYPPLIQKILLESLLRPYLRALETIFPGTWNILSFESNPKGITPSELSSDLYRFQFRIYEDNPHHGGGSCVLSGQVSLANSLFDMLIPAIEAVPKSKYALYDGIFPKLIVTVGATELTTGEVKHLEVGDVILMDSTSAYEEGNRQLMGLPGYEFLAHQNEQTLEITEILSQENPTGLSI